MKKSLLFVIIIFSCLGINAQEENDTWVSVAKMNWVGADIQDYNWYSSFSETMEIVDDGLAVNNLHLLDYAWDLQVPVLASFSLEEGHDYIVRMTVKVPSDGIYRVDLCSWDGSGASAVREFPAKAGNDFQIIDVEYPEYKYTADNCMVMFCCGWVVGTTIIKEVEIFEKTHVADIKHVKVTRGINDALYNLTGQKVSTHYKGIVIQNGKKVAMK